MKQLVGFHAVTSRLRQKPDTVRARLVTTM